MMTEKMTPLLSLPKLIPLEYCTVKCAVEMLSIENAYIEHWRKVGSIKLFHMCEDEKLTFKCFGVEGSDDEIKLKNLIGKNLTYKHGHIVVDDVKEVKTVHKEEATEIDADYIEIDVTLTGLVHCEWSFSDLEDYSTHSVYSITPDMLKNDIKFSYMIASQTVEANRVEDLGWELDEKELYVTFDGLKAIHDAISEGQMIPKIDMPDSMEKALKELKPKGILTENGDRASKQTLALAVVALAKRLSKEDPTTISNQGKIKVKRVVELATNTIKTDDVLRKYDNNLANLGRAIKDVLALE